MAATYAFSFVFANLGIAIAARMPIITTTISSSISVKPLRVLFDCLLPPVRVGASRCAPRSAADKAGAVPCSAPR